MTEPGGAWSCPVRRSAIVRPDQVALRVGQVVLTYAQLDREVSLAVTWLTSLGVRAGDRVAVLGPNSLPWAIVAHALGRIGAPVVALNVRLTANELAPLIALAEPQRILVDPALRDRLPSGVYVHALKREAWQDLAPSDDSGDRTHPADAMRGILFTSGTSGRSKAAALSYGNFVANARSSAANLGGGRDQVWMGSLPLFHIGGLAMLLRSAEYGCTLSLHASFDAAAVNREIDELGVTHVSLVATTLLRTLEARGERHFPPTFRAALIGGGPVTPELLAWARRLGAPAAQTYGLTEACSQVTTEHLEHADGTTAGPALPGTEVRIVDADGALLPPDTVGEIEVRGPTVMLGYFRDTDATHQTLWKGWLRTRDLGSMDAQGRLRIVSRRTDLIVSGGENVYPAEIEAVIARHPAVADAAVAPVADARWGQVAVALIVWRSEPQPEALESFLSDHLARYKVPRRFLSVAAVPRNAMGKLDRPACRMLAETSSGNATAG